MPHHENPSLLQALSDCARECEHCSYTICVEQPDMADCARACIDCSHMCWTAEAFVSRGSHAMPQVLRACAEVCDWCASECEQHDHPEVQRCAEICRRCADQCRSAIAVRA